MVKRRAWREALERAWRERSVVWLAGVRRVGKTCLCQSLDRVEYFDCELPRVRRLLEDPEAFLESLQGKRVILDEVHRLPDPTGVLKIASDHFPATRLIATGSSTLAASAKFRDSLTGRKRDLWLTPMTLADLDDFGERDGSSAPAGSPSLRRGLQHRLLRGGLPPMFLAGELPERDYQDWLDGYWAKDIQELFRLERRASFLRFCELVFAQSGGLFEATRFTRPCEVSRPTIANYLSVLESTFVATVVRPFSTRRVAEIVAAPKVYAFDTGFVCAFRGWTALRPEDLDLLFEHLVLNEIQASLQSHPVQYWRDKAGHEVDFVVVRRGKAPLAIECKWSVDGFDPGNLGCFRRRYPKGENLLVAADAEREQTRRYGELSVRVVGLRALGSLVR